MNDSEVGRRVRDQVRRFSGIFSPRFSKPQAQFVEQMIYGIQAAQDVKLSNISRALGETIKLKKTEERLSHHLGRRGMGQVINQAVVGDAAYPADSAAAASGKMPMFAAATLSRLVFLTRYMASSARCSKPSLVRESMG